MRTEDITPEKMLAYAKDNGIDLTDEEIDSIAGGFYLPAKDKVCPNCKSKRIVNPIGNNTLFICQDCATKFN